MLHQVLGSSVDKGREGDGAWRVLEAEREAKGNISFRGPQRPARI